ncbi:MAG TPA: glutathione-disulfide reductase [Candidatus Cybelea sp.]|nr:glutathione-disulfide reductase [Candidatus Cybelea sp.]
MASYDYDLFVIGAGSGGVRASRMAASYGAKVAIAEHYRIGGTCVIRGCIPKKLLVYASHFHEDFEDARAFGWDVDPAHFTWPRLIANKDKEIDRLNGIYIKLLKASGVAMFEGTARLEDAHTVRIGERKFTAKYILISTGGWPVKPPVPGVEHAITSNEAFHLPDLPKRVVVVGGGYIAVEFAGIFNGLGAKTTLLYRGEQILRGFDDDLRHHLAAEMAKKGVTVRTKSDVTRIEKLGDGSLKVTLLDGSHLACDAVMYATGRKPNTAGIGLEDAGVKLDAGGAVAVDAYSQTSVPNIYSVGDVTDRIQLTPVAIKEGAAVAATLFAGKPTRADHNDVPSAVFSQPPIGTVGLTEAEARERFGAVDIYKSTFKPLKHTLTGRNEQTLMKLVVDAKSGRVVGAHMVGADAAEIIQGVGIAVKLGATKEQFDATVGIHPTAAEEFVTMREKWVAPAKAAAE